MSIEEKTTMGNTIAAAFLAEFEHELKTTRRFLERVPEEKFGWRPHEKSMTAGQLSLHMAQVPERVLTMALPDESPMPNMAGERPAATTVREVVETLDRGAAFVREKLPAITDARMQATLRITRDGKVIVEMPRAAFLRNILLNHWYHHRGQLGVYLRLLGASVPSSYGPSGDEPPSFD
jgi:uncharacterized damage-inducible protein DinB